MDEELKLISACGTPAVQMVIGAVTVILAAPMSLPGVTEITGAVVSTSTSCVVPALTLLNASVAVAVMIWLPSDKDDTVIL